ncbi:MAG: sigma factor-like helix-turn-helix DNA-binding protein [Solirubrobacteraceae bacterium]
MRAPFDHDEAVRNAAHGDPAALGALFDAHGPEVYAFCHRLLGTAEPAADATQDAFLAATEVAARPGYDPARFRETLLSAARTASLELLGSRGGAGRAGGTLSAATMRLRPQQRAALALVGLAGLSYAATARILEVHPGAVAPLLARARLRLRDEMHGTAAAAAAVRSPDCEEALPLLAAEADGELDATEAGWLRDHAADCESCPRTRAAMGEAAATYAAWSAMAPPSWLQASTLAEFESDHALSGAGAMASATPTAAAAATAGPRRRRAGATAAVGPQRPGLATAALGGALVIVAFALLVAVAAGPLRDANGPNGSVGPPGGSQTVEVARAPAVAVPDAGAAARAERAATDRARRAADARARTRSRSARARAAARDRAANASSGAQRQVSTRSTTARRRTGTTPRPSAVAPRRRTSTPAARRPARRTAGTARRPRRTTTTPTPAATPAPAPAPSTGSADEPAATASTPAPAAPAAPTSTSRPTQSTSSAPAVAAPAAPSSKGRGCGHGGCGAPPRCSPHGNCHKDKGKGQNED